jgi:hypothetical protein
MLRRFLISLVAAVLLVMATRADPTQELVVGQIWSIKSASPTTTKVVIGRIEAWKDKVVIHVSIIDVPIPNGISGAGGMTRIDHMPFEKSALEASLDQLLKTDMSPAPHFEDGYQQWQSAKGAIFIISIPQAIEFAFQAMRR